MTTRDFTTLFVPAFLILLLLLYMPEKKEVGHDEIIERLDALDVKLKDLIKKIK